MTATTTDDSRVLSWADFMGTGRAGWLALWQAREASPDLSPMWAESLIAGHGLPREHLYVVVRGPASNPSLVWPFQWRQARRHGLPWREVAPLQNVYCYHAGLLADGEPVAAMGEVMTALSGWSRRWDACRVDAVVFGSPLHLALQSHAGLGLQAEPTFRSPYLQHQGGFDSLLAQRSSNFREKARARRRELVRTEGLVLQQYREPAEMPAYLEHALAVERKSWKAQEGSAITSRDWETAFYRALLEAMAPLGLVTASVLFREGQPIAHSLDICHAGRVFGMKWSFDLDHSKLRPGVLLTTERLARYFDGGVTEFDFLGADEPYKLQWTETVRQHLTLQWYAHTRRALFVQALGVARRNAAPRVAVVA